jgi:LacI family transcriptional regulator
MNTRSNRVTIHDVAKAAGVSVSTVSKALNGSGRMTAETRERIKNAASAAGFRPNALARSLLFRRSMTIGLLTNDTYGRFTLPLMSGISEALVDQGVSVFLCAMEDDPDLAKIHVDAMLDKQVDGIIATGKRIDRSLPVDLAGLPVPVIYAFSQGAPGSVVLTADDGQGAELAVKRLRSVGRKNIVHITGPESFASARERAQAFRKLVGEGAAVTHGEWTEAWGHQSVAALFDRDGARPDGIFCGNDQIARGVVDALRERGIRVPEDVSIVGFDNWEIVADQTRPALTTVDMNLKELGRVAGLTILDLAEGRAVAPGLRKLACRLVVRRSCGGDQNNDGDQNN